MAEYLWFVPKIKLYTVLLLFKMAPSPCSVPTEKGVALVF